MREPNVQYECLLRPYDFSSPFHGEEFAVLLYVADKCVSPAEQAKVSRALVAQGCRYAVCAGCNCSSWDDSIDFAALERSDCEPKDEDFVMTTWHENEKLTDIARFFLYDTGLGRGRPERFLVLILGDNPGDRREIEEAIRG
jgi:hypothetical protein